MRISDGECLLHPERKVSMYLHSPWHIEQCEDTALRSIAARIANHSPIALSFPPTASFGQRSTFLQNYTEEHRQQDRSSSRVDSLSPTPRLMPAKLSHLQRRLCR